MSGEWCQRCGSMCKHQGDLIYSTLWGWVCRKCAKETMHDVKPKRAGKLRGSR